MTIPPPASPPPRGQDGYSVFATFIKDVTLAQEARKSSIEQRGLAVITTSGTLVTLLFAIISLSTKARQTYQLPDSAHLPLLASLVLFSLAALGGLFTNLPASYVNVLPTELTKSIDHFWNEDAWSASGRVSRTYVKFLETARERNGKKARILFFAVLLESLAMISLGVSVGIIVIKS
jgi:hypothetical protein